MVARIDSPQLDMVLRALADGTRRDIVRRTAGARVSVSQLARDYDMSFAAVQKHVAVLEKAGLVRKHASGRERHVSAAPQELARARICLEQLEALWHHRITALDALLAEEASEEAQE